MNQNKIYSLYELIKQKFLEKGRPLKIVADWDEVLQPSKPLIIYQISDKKLSFAEFFKHFWSNVKIVYKLHGTKIKRYSYVSNDPAELDDQKLKKCKVEMFGSEFYPWAPLLTIADDLLLALKEGLISRLNLISSYKRGGTGVDNNPGKEKKFANSFGKFPQSNLLLKELTINSEGEAVPHRHETIKEKWPDFDIFIDDNPAIIEESNKFFNDESKILVVPDYKSTEYLQAPNIYHVKQEVSDLKDEDFTKAAEEYKEKTKTSNNKWIDANTKSFLLWFGLAVLVLCGLGLVYVLIKRVKKKR